MKDYNSPATYPISAKKRKRLVKKKKAEKKPKAKTIKQEYEGKTFHEVPPMVENGGIVEVQVMEEGEIFDPDAFLDELAQQWHPLPPSTPQTSTEPFRNPSPPPRRDTEMLYSCPVHLNDTLQKKETDTQYGHWKYHKCPVQNCFVSCGVDNVEYYFRVCQTSTQLLPDQIHARHEVLLPSSINHVQVSVREESWEIIPEMFQTAV